MESGVHPRGRGEQLPSKLIRAKRPGSSPRARGTDLINEVSAHTYRFIPAGAGNSVLPVVPAVDFAVHPRGRGEQSMPRCIRIMLDGSSPRARGTVLINSG